MVILLQKGYISHITIKLGAWRWSSTFI